MRFKLFILTMAAVLGNSFVLADEPGTASAGQSPSGSFTGFNWAGGYFGAQLGWLDSNQDVDNVSKDFGVVKTWDPDPDGLIGGLYVGYNWQRGRNLVYGIEAEYNWSGSDGTDTIATPVGGRTFVEKIDTEINNTASVRGRIGYAMARTLFYASAGWAWIDHEGKYTSELTGFTPRQQSWSEKDNGWTLGAGLEHAFSDRWIGRLDYRYSDFGKNTYAPLLSSTTNRLRGNLKTHEIRAGIAYRF